MAYADFEFYVNSYYGDILTEEIAEKWLQIASDFVDAVTFHRTEYAFPVVENDALKVRKAVCAIAEAKYLIDLQTKAALATDEGTGTLHGSIASISSGRESISFAQNGSGSTAYAKAATDKREETRQLREIAMMYLSCVADSNGINLVYAGVS